MNILEILDNFVRIEEQLSIQSPTPMKVAKAYRTVPAGGGPLVDLPCFMHWPGSPESGRDTAYNESQTITIQVQFFCEDSDNDSGMEIALAFFQEAMNAFDAERPYQARFGQTVDNVSRIYGQTPFIGEMNFANLGYPGFSLYVDLEVINNQLVGAS